jgi:hypothetical protein
MERRGDVRVGNARRFIEAMGGELEIVARFSDGAVKISNFAGLGGKGAVGDREWTEREAGPARFVALP